MAFFPNGLQLGPRGGNLAVRFQQGSIRGSQLGFGLDAGDLQLL
jgi:hypothetical protein